MSTPIKPDLPQFAVNPVTMKMSNPSDIVPVYANNASVLQMPHDFRLVFSEVVSDGPADAPRIELRASVGMSPTMLKAVYQAIGKTLEPYEKKNGEIKWPPQQPKTN